MRNSATTIVEHTTLSQCRSCGSEKLHLIIDLGTTPLADRLLRADQLDEPEPVCPLTAVFCEQCTLLQIRETVPPEILFPSSYPYYSSVSESLLRHFQGNVAATRKRKRLDESSLVIELASNDGYLLKNYLSTGIAVLGIDPADGPVSEARAAGVETVHDFFTLDLAGELVRHGKMADVIHANNVLAHIANTNGFVAGIACLLKADGLVVVECPYVGDLVNKLEFDTIYHQHLCYFSMHSLIKLFARHGLYVNDLELLEIHGGSLRLFIEKRNEPQESVTRLLAIEKSSELTSVDFYRGFAGQVMNNRARVREILNELKSAGHKIVGYGAPAKGCTLMSFFGIDRGLLDCLIDKSRFKQGMYFPGNRLEIQPPEWLLRNQPDYALLLPWNFADEILEEQKAYRKRGGKFIIPIPEPKIV